jgi:uncharacterized protein YjbI with pentapeptide repeats
MVNLEDDDPIDATDIEPEADFSGMDLTDADLSSASITRLRSINEQITLLVSTTEREKSWYTSDR